MPNQQNIQQLFNRSIEVKKLVVNSNAAETINQMAKVIVGSIQSGNKLLLCGNGGSAADAQHLAAELVVRLRPNINRKALPAISLAIDASFLTACGNDYSFDDIFARSLEALGRKGDVLLGITTSGNSENVLKAIIKAQEIGIKACAFLGAGGGKINGISDYQYIVPSNETGRIQEVHIMLGHALMETIEDTLINNDYI